VGWVATLPAHVDIDLMVMREKRTPA